MKNDDFVLGAPTCLGLATAFWEESFDVAVDSSFTTPKILLCGSREDAVAKHPPIVKTDPMQQTAEDVFDVTGYQGLEKYGVAVVNNAHDELSLRARKRCSPAADTPLWVRYVQARNDKVDYPVRSVVKYLRRAGVVGG